MAQRTMPPLTEEIEDRLEQLGADTARIQVWTMLERNLLKSVREAHDVLPERTRGDILTYVSGLAHVVAIPEDKVFTAAALFDLAFLRMGHADAKTKLPELSCAVINVMRKIDDASYDTRGTDLVQRTCVFAKQLRSKGDANTNIDIAMEDIVKAERALLSALQWQIDIPSLQQWLQLLVNRFAVLCPWTTQRLKWVHSVTFQYGKCIVLKQVTYKQVCPQEVAHGLFCTGLVLAGIVPIESLCPVGVDKVLWEARWRNRQVWPGMQARSAAYLVPTDVATCLLELVMDAPIKDLQDATEESIGLVWASVNLHSSETITI